MDIKGMLILNKTATFKKKVDPRFLPTILNAKRRGRKWAKHPHSQRFQGIVKAREEHLETERRERQIEREKNIEFTKEDELLLSILESSQTSTNENGGKAIKKRGVEQQEKPKKRDEKDKKIVIVEQDLAKSSEVVNEIMKRSQLSLSKQTFTEYR